MLKHHLVICSFNRPRELYVSLMMLRQQERLPNTIAIVITKDDDLDQDSKSALDFLLQSGVQSKVLHSKRGLTSQRNLALENIPSDSDIVTFIDDDILLPPNYLFMVHNIFLEFDFCIGLGGITSDNPQNYKVSNFRRFFMLDSRIPGKILRSGVNTTFKFSPNPYKVEWLPGCCMSYRVKNIGKIQFDERRSEVGWGEDVDFSAKIMRVGTLMAFYTPGIVHTQSKRNRASNLERAIQNDFSRLLLAKDKIGRVSTPFIYLSLFGEILTSISITKYLKTAILNFLKNILGALRLRFYSLLVAIKRFFTFSGLSFGENPIKSAIRLIRFQILDGVVRLKEFKSNYRKVMKIEK